MTRQELAFAVRFVRSTYGLKLKVEKETFVLARRFLKAVNNEKLQLTKDKTLGASLYWAKFYAKRDRLGVYRKGA